MFPFSASQRTRGLPSTPVLAISGRGFTVWARNAYKVKHMLLPRVTSGATAESDDVRKARSGDTVPYPRTASTDNVVVSLWQAEHQNFSDWCMLAPGWLLRRVGNVGPADPVRCLHAVCDFSRQFLIRHVVLDGASNSREQVRRWVPVCLCMCLCACAVLGCAGCAAARCRGLCCMVHTLLQSRPELTRLHHTHAPRRRGSKSWGSASATPRRPRRCWTRRVRRAPSTPTPVSSQTTAACGALLASSPLTAPPSMPRPCVGEREPARRRHTLLGTRLWRRPWLPWTTPA